MRDTQERGTNVAPEKKLWTIAYRRPKANRFLRVDLSLTWAEAKALANRAGLALPDHEIYYVGNQHAELTEYVPEEDRGNIFTHTAARVRIREGGVLPEGVTAEFEKDVHTEHCCTECGCKYGEADCPVENDFKVPSFSCEFCD